MGNSKGAFKMNTPPYTITLVAADYLAKITETITRLEFGTGFKRNIMLHRKNRIRTIYSSLKIENNTLSLDEVTDVINGKRVAGEKNDIKEVKNAYVAYEKILTFDPYELKDFLKAHKLLTNGLIDESGLFRSKDVGVFDGTNIVHMGARPEFVHGLISDLLTWAKESDLHPLIKSGVMHYEIETIHPFADGNGRMGRLWQTLLLSKWKEIFAWIPMESVIYEKRQEYYDAIEIAREENDSAKFIEYTLSALYESVLHQIDIQENTTLSGGVNDVVNGGENDGVSGGENLRLNSTQEAVFEAIRSNNYITTAQLIVTVGKTKSTIERAIKALKEKGFLKREGPDKGGHWEVTNM
jgi:Fic family protein